MTWEYVLMIIVLVFVAMVLLVFVFSLVQNAKAAAHRREIETLRVKKETARQ